MQRSQLVALALAGAASVLLQGCAKDEAPAPGPGDKTGDGCTTLVCTKCQAWVSTMVDGQIDDFEPQLEMVCKQTPGTTFFNKITGKNMTTVQACMDEGQKSISSAVKDKTSFAQNCTKAVMAGASGNATTEGIEAAFAAWKNGASNDEAETLKNQISGELDNLAKEWGVKWESTKAAYFASTNNSALPDRLYSRSGVQADAAGSSTNTLLLGAAAFVLFSLAVVGVKKVANTNARDFHHYELEEGLDASDFAEGLE